MLRRVLSAALVFGPAAAALPPSIVGPFDIFTGKAPFEKSDVEHEHIEGNSSSKVGS